MPIENSKLRKTSETTVVEELKKAGQICNFTAYGDAHCSDNRVRQNHYGQDRL